MNAPVQRSVFSTHDPDEGLAVLDEVFALREVRCDAEDAFAMQLSTTCVGPLTHGRVRLTGSSATGRTDGADVLRACHVSGGTLLATSPGDRYPRTGPFLFPQRTYTSWWEHLEAVTVTLDPALVQEHARALLGDDAFRLRFTGIRPASPAMARYWLACVSHLGRDVLPDDRALGNPLIRADVVRTVTTVLLHAFPSSFLDRAHEAPGPSRRSPAGVRRAVAFIEEHAAEGLGVAEIAAAAGMSVRGLQAAFRRELDTTPVALLRDTRLDAAHQDLQRADPTAGATVEAIAARWGFTHRGRFAAAYRARHGRSPTTTLHS